MGRARGSEAMMQLAWETTYGTPPTTGYAAMPFVQSSLGATRGLIESDLLGQGRKPFDPTPDVVMNDGDVVVPIDTVHFGKWLRLLLGAPNTTPSDDIYNHLFLVRDTVLPSASIQIGHPKVPSYSINYGVRANTLRVQQQRGGLLNATIGCIAKGETTPGASSTITGSSTVVAPFTRFAQSAGAISIDSETIGQVVDGSFAYSNNLDKIETIRADAEIEDVDAGMAAASGQVRLRFANHDLLNRAIGGVPVELTHVWAGPGGTYFSAQFKRVFLPRPKRSIDGPGGIMATFDWQASTSDDGELMAARLNSPVASYA